MPVGPIPEGREPDGYDRMRRRILWLIPNGLYVLGTRAGSRRNLMTISWVTQVALEPKMVGVGVERGSFTHQLLTEGGIFALSVLARADKQLVRKFAKPVDEGDVEVDERTGTGTMKGTAVFSSPTGAPVLAPAIAFVDCELRHALELGSHSWFVGEVVDCGYGPDFCAGAGSATDRDVASCTETEVLRMEDTKMNYGG